MKYADNEYKFVAVLNRKIPLPILLNALGHMAAGIGATEQQRDAMRFLHYEDANGGSHPNISKYPFIILAAKNGNQIRRFRQDVRGLDLPYTDFTNTMLGTSAADQLQQTRDCQEADLDYFGLCTFGAAEQLDSLTKKFSLFSAS